MFQYRTDNVFEAVWVGCALLSYMRNKDLLRESKEINEDSYWFLQSEIQKASQQLCLKTVQNARINQWTNGDHENNSYNFLRENGKLRRLTARGEFKNIKEFPQNLFEKKELFINYECNKLIKISDLIDWFTVDYCRLFNEKPII